MTILPSSTTSSTPAHPSLELQTTLMFFLQVSRSIILSTLTRLLFIFFQMVTSMVTQSGYPTWEKQNSTSWMSLKLRNGSGNKIHIDDCQNYVDCGWMIIHRFSFQVLQSIFTMKHTVNATIQEYITLGELLSG